MRSILNVSVILAANMEMCFFFRIWFILEKRGCQIYDYAIYNHEQKTVFEKCTHFRSSGVTEHNKIKTGLSEEMDIISLFLIKTEIISTVSCMYSFSLIILAFTTQSSE